MATNSKFVTTITCIDGRVQIPVNRFLQERYNVEYVDTITEAGPNKILADATDEVLLNSIKARYEVSTVKHESKVCAVVGHFDCGGNPSEKEEQLEQIKLAVKLVKSWNESVEVFGLWVDENWTVHQL